MATKPRKWFDIAQNGDEITVSIRDEIGAWGVTPEAFIDEIQPLDGEGKRFRFPINSIGGEVFAGYAIANFISNMKAETVAYVEGIAASIASLIAISADRVVMPENSMMMIHEPWTVVAGPASEMRKTADTLDKIKGQLVTAYEAKADRTLGENRSEGAESFEALVSAESYLTAQECLALGLADEVVEAVRIKACITPAMMAKFRNANTEALAPFFVAEGGEVEETGEAEEITAEIVGDVAPEEDPADASADAEEEARVAAEAHAASVQALCVEFGAADRAPSFIEARSDLETIRAELKKAARKALVAADEATELDTRIVPAAPSDAEQASGLSLRAARERGLQLMRGQR